MSKNVDRWVRGFQSIYMQTYGSLFFEKVHILTAIILSHQTNFIKPLNIYLLAETLKYLLKKAYIAIIKFQHKTINQN